MLILRRADGQWLDIQHKASGDVIRIRVYDLRSRGPTSPGHLNMAFDDDARHFQIERPERKPRPAAEDQLSETPSSSPR